MKRKMIMMVMMVMMMMMMMKLPMNRDAKSGRNGRYICAILFKAVLILLYNGRIGT